MKKASLLKVAALLLTLVMMLTFATGCGGGAATSDPVSDDEGAFVADDDYQFDTSNLEQNGSTVSTKPNGNGDNSNISAIENSDGLIYSDNVEIFKNIPKELKGKTVLFSDWGEAVATEYQKVVTQFVKDTGIRVKMVQFLNTEYISKVSQQIAAGKSPDIAASNSTFPAALEMLQPLPSIFNVYDKFWDHRVSEATKINGKYYFVNTYNSPFTGGYVVYYNKTLFNSAGLKTPQEYYDEGNWTYETFKKVAKDVTSAGYKGAMFDPIIIAQQHGAGLIEYNSTTSKFSGSASNPDFIKSMQYYSSGLEEGVFVSGSASNFSHGGIGLAMLGTYGLKYDGYFKDLLPSQIGVLPCPNSLDGKKLDIMPLGYRGYGICKGAQNAEAAYYLLRYFLDLDKYEPAGANIFANKPLEKYFRQKQLVQFQNSPLYFAYFEGVLPLTGNGWSGSSWTAVKTASTGQIAVELSKMKNVLDAAADAGNKKIKDFTK